MSKSYWPGVDVWYKGWKAQPDTNRWEWSQQRYGASVTRILRSMMGRIERAPNEALASLPVPHLLMIALVSSIRAPMADMAHVTRVLNEIVPYIGALRDGTEDVEGVCQALMDIKWRVCTSGK